MGYRRGRRRYYSYSRYSDHSDRRVNKYFKPIIDDIKKYFFNLPTSQYSLLMLSYKNQYGSAAYEYAIETYNNWKSGRTGMSEQTLIRLVKTLPRLLTSKERYNLMEKIALYYEQNQRKEYLYVNTTWNTYTKDLADTGDKILKQFNTYCPKISFDQEMLDVAVWLSMDDMVVAKNVLDNFFLNRYKLMAVSAQKDIRRFITLCSNLHIRDEIYSDQVLEIFLPAVVITVTVQAEKKSIFKAISDWLK